jgi:ankyrin repeat protein
MIAIKKNIIFIALLLLGATFNPHRIHAMEPNHQQMLLELCTEPATPQILSEIESLCERADIDLNFVYRISDKSSTTLLISAATENNCPVIQLLLRKGADINATTLNGFTPLMKAIDSGSMDAFQCLLEDPNININQQTKFGYTALMSAAIANDCFMIETLLEHGAEINKTTTKGKTALMLATELGNTDAVESLLDDPNLAINQQDDDGNTALMLALLKQDTFELIQLIAAGADPVIANNAGLTPLQAAEQIGDREIIYRIRQAILKKRSSAAAA